MATDGLQDAAKVRVLIVDDDAALRRMVSMVLQDAEWDYIEARNGIEALAALRSSPGHLVVLLDWKMPEMSGEEVLEVVAATPELALRHSYVLITANAAAITAHLEDLLNRLDVPTVAKPFSIRELLGTVQRQGLRFSQTTTPTETREVR
jgi:two-component system OmpR family response regulator